MKRRYSILLAIVGLNAFAACDTPQPTEPLTRALTLTADERRALAAQVRQLAAGRGIGQLPQAPHVRQALVRLGRALAFDPILSGTRDISCMTCHEPAFATGDAKSLSVGQGGTGRGPERSHPQGVFIPRNAPPLFNLGALQKLFWDGRVEIDDFGVLHTPAGAQLTSDMSRVFEFGAVSALALFPVTNRFEMRGFSGNELAEISDQDFRAIWRGIMARLGEIAEYRELFEAAYPGTPFADMTFAHASNAIGGFFVDQLTFASSPWDRFLAGSEDAMNEAQLEGARTFLTLRCSICHSGPTFSDQQFHGVAVAQIGPGVGDGMEDRDDFGRMKVTGFARDRYLFRTTPLRNVELTAPYGHDGAIVDLRAFVEHYSESDKKLMSYDPAQLEFRLRGTVLPNADRVLAQRDTLLNGVVLSDDLVNKLMAFMLALTDTRARDLRQVSPERVPSGLPMR